MIRKIKYRNYPLNGIIKPEYRYDYHHFDDNLEEYIYYETTPIESITWNGCHALSWIFFSVDGLNYLLPKILIEIQEKVDNLYLEHKLFIEELTIEDNFRELFNNLNLEELRIIKDIFLSLLEQPKDVLDDIGENYLISDLEFISKLCDLKSGKNIDVMNLSQ